MSMQSSRCPHCGEPFSYELRTAGYFRRCSACKNVFRTPRLYETCCPTLVQFIRFALHATSLFMGGPGLNLLAICVDNLDAKLE
jgi:hypothetical protein